MIVAFFWLTRRIFHIGRQAIALDRVFAGLMAQGIGIWMGGQAFINMGVNLGVLPTKGLTLPLMSYGGSAIADEPGRAGHRAARRHREPTADARRAAHERSACHLVIMAAGTGGHVIPGLAVAREMQRARLDASAGWARATAWRTGWCRPRGIALDRIAFSGLRGKGLLHTLTGGLRLLGAFWDCLRILRRRGADAVLGMGGYVCFPGGLMASLLGKPLVLVNADASLLLSNKALLPVADRVAFGFDGAAAARTKQRRRHRQPGARRDRGAARAGAALRRPQRPAAPAGGGRQPGRAVLNDTRAAGAGAVAAGAAPAGHPPDRQRAPRRRARRLRAAPASRPRCCPSSTTWRSAWPTAT